MKNAHVQYITTVVDFCFYIFKRNGIAFDAIIIILEDRGNEMKSDVCA